MHFPSIASLAVAFLAITPSVSGEEKRPNIVFILADDLGWQDVGFMGSKYFETPNLDALAEESLVFENAFMYPTCSPSRAAIFTGQQSFRTGCYTVPVLEKGNDKDNVFSKWTVGKDHPIYSEPLNEAGYKLIHLGKYHIVGPYPEREGAYPFKKKLSQPRNGDLSWLEAHKSAEIEKFYPTGRGFHENVGGTWWGDPARGYDKGYAAKGGGYVAPFKNPFIEAREDDEWLSDRLTSEAIGFMERHKDEPFFVNLNFYAPHKPSVARDEESLEYFMNKPADGVTGQGKGKRGEIAKYATMIKSIDENVKRITDYLDANGLRENTVIIFTSDNGFNEGQSKNDNLRGAKGSIYDGGLRVPSLINWRGKVAAGKSAEPIQGLDYFPTLLELGGITGYEGELDGKSLVPLMNGDTMKERSIFWHVASTYKTPPSSVIREGDWKLIQFLKNGNIELYNTGKNPKESEDLAKVNPERAAAMLEKLVDWRVKNEVPLPPSSTLKN